MQQGSQWLGILCGMPEYHRPQKRVSERSGGTQISSLETDIARFRQHTPASIRDTMAYMEEQKTRMNKTSFDKLQTAMGFNYKPPGLLAHPAYGPPVIDCIMYDWFHIFL